MNRSLSVACTALAILAVTGTTLAQQGRGGGGDQNDRQPGGGRRDGQPGQGPGMGGPGMIERLMQADANGDGMLQWDEVPEQIRERVFERNDTNKDKVLDKAELEAMRQRGPGGPGGPGGRGGPDAQGEPMSMHDAMAQAGRALRSLRRSEFTAATRTQDLRAVQQLQAAMIAAKGDIANTQMSGAAKSKYKDDSAAFQRDLRRALIAGAIKALELESAINEEDSAAAITARDALMKHQDESHTLFQPDDGNRPAGGGRRGGGRPGEGGQPGGGGGAGGGGNRGGRPPQ